MKGIAVLALLAIVLAGPAGATVSVPGATAPKAPAERVWDDLTQAFSNVKHRPVKEVLDLVEALVASADFKLLEPNRRQIALMQASRLAVRAHEPDDAVRLMAAATQVDPANESIWVMRFLVGQQSKSIDAGIALTTMAERWPAMVRGLPDATVLDVVSTVHNKADPHELALLEALYAIRWSPSDPLESASNLWRDLALLLIGQGKMERAMAVTRDISDPYTMISIQSDRRFDALVKADPERFDVARTARAQLEDVRARAEAAKDQLEVANGVVVGLIRRNRPLEALALADQLLVRIADKSGATSLVDLESEEPWTRLYRARALRDLGRDEEAFAELRRAGRSDNRPADVAVVIDVAQAFYEASRPDEALATLAALSSTTGEMRMEVEQVNVCSYVQKGARDKAELALVYLRDHEADSLDALELALLCKNDQNALAGLYIRHLRDQSLRAEMLTFVQLYAEPKAEPEFVRTLGARRTAVLRRPDVTAAIQAVGRIGSWPFQAKRY